MTHPSDRVYRFQSLAHFGKGFAKQLVFSSDGKLVTPRAQMPRQIAVAAPGQTIRLLAADPCGRLLWLDESGSVFALEDDLPARMAMIDRDLARRAGRLLWGQQIAWVVADGELVRLDAKSGDRMGAFTTDGRRVLDVVGDRCDGAISVEIERGKPACAWLRQIRPEGKTRDWHQIDDVTDITALARLQDQGAVHVVDRKTDGWCVITVVEPENAEIDSYRQDDDGPVPGRMVTMDGQGRLIFGARPDQLFSAAFGLLGPVQKITTVSGMGAIIDLLWTGGKLYVATARGIYVLEDDDEAAQPLEAQYITPPLRSPPGPRSGWLRADLWTSLPNGAQITIKSRGFDNAAGFAEALRDDPQGALVQDDWNDERESVHLGSGAAAPLRHHLGEETAEYLALRFDISLPACSPPMTLERLDVLYPNRSLIEQLPAIYHTEDRSEAQLRRMLAPFQALADEIDDLIGNSIRRVDPKRTDDVWSGFLLRWLGHGTFARLPVALRRALLQVMPEALAKRGTLEGLARVMDVLAPEGYAIEDTGLGPDIWVLPERGDPAGARLGRETLAGAGASDGLRLGCDPLGTAPIGHGCFDQAAVAKRCSGDIIIRVFGGAAIEEALSPFVDRIIRAFVPAHTHARFIFGPHRPPELLERGRPIGPETDPESLITLDPGLSRALGAWRLPEGGTRIVHHDTVTLDSAVLDGTLVLA